LQVASHAGLVRTVLYRKGIAMPALIVHARKISDARDRLDGASDLDQGIATAANRASNIVPTDSSGLAHGRSAPPVLKVAFLNRLSVSRGGSFPAGVNGALSMSAAN
jgi:hypothetical protein